MITTPLSSSLSRTFKVRTAATGANDMSDKDLSPRALAHDIQTQVDALYNNGNDKGALEALQKYARQLYGKPQRQNDDIESENESAIKNLIGLQNSQKVEPGQRPAMDDKEPLTAAEKHLRNNVNSVQAELLKIEKKGHLPEVHISLGEGCLLINSSHRFKDFTRYVQATSNYNNEIWDDKDSERVDTNAIERYLKLAEAGKGKELETALKPYTQRTRAIFLSEIAQYNEMHRKDNPHEPIIYFAKVADNNLTGSDTRYDLKVKNPSPGLFNGGDPVLYELRIGDKSKLDTTQDNDKNYSSANEVSMLNFYR